MLRIRHSEERSKLKQLLLKFYPPFAYQDISKAHIGSIVRFRLSLEDDIEIFEHELESLDDFEHREEILAKYQREVEAITGPYIPDGLAPTPEVSWDAYTMDQSNVCRDILEQRVNGEAHHCEIINSILTQRSSSSPLAPIDFTNLDSEPLRLVGLLVLFLELTELPIVEKDVHNFDELVQRELSLICIIIAANVPNNIQRPSQPDQPSTLPSTLARALDRYEARWYGQTASSNFLNSSFESSGSFLLSGSSYPATHPDPSGSTNQALVPTSMPVSDECLDPRLASLAPCMGPELVSDHDAFPSQFTSTFTSPTLRFIAQGNQFMESFPSVPATASATTLLPVWTTPTVMTQSALEGDPNSAQAPVPHWARSCYNPHPHH